MPMRFEVLSDMTARGLDQGQLEGTQYVADVQPPGAPGQVTYYPSKPTPEFEKKMKRDRTLGTAVVIIGFALVTLGFVPAYDNRGISLVTVLLVAVFSLLFTFLFIFMGNVALIKVARTLPIIGYIALFIIVLYAHIALLSLLQQITSPDINLIMSLVYQAFPQIWDFIMFIGLLIIRGGATLLWDIYRLRTDFSPSIIVLGQPSAAAQPPTYAPRAQVPQVPPPPPPPQKPAGQPAPPKP